MCHGEKKSNAIKYTLFSWVITSFAVSAHTDDYAEFDASFIQGASNASGIDVKKFSYGNPVNPGDYNLDIYVNDQYRGHAVVKFTDNGDITDATNRLCVSSEWVGLLDLKEVPRHLSANCMRLDSLAPGATAAIDFSVLRLNLSVPQGLLLIRPPDYISPVVWQDGVTAGFVSYNFNDYRYFTNHQTQNSQFLSLHTGANLDGWALRHDGTYTSGSGYTAQQNYLQHDLTAIKSRLTLGDFSTENSVMESISLRGVKVASDLQMHPQSERGYAPEVSGIANSNARVQIRQAGNLIYETTVSPGPFTISSLYSTPYGGDLQVSILESDGSTRVFTVPYASTSEMIRPGTYRYQAAAGKYRYGSERYESNVVNATLQYGFNNLLTLNSGLITADRYRSVLLGTAYNLPVGALTTDATLAKAEINNESRRGYSLHASYSVTFSPTSTYLSFAAYRYSSENYYSLNDVMLNAYRQYLIDNNIEYRFNSKSQYQISLTQPLGKGYGSFYINAFNYNYWYKQQNTTQYQIGYNNSYQQVNYSVGVSRTASSYYSGHDNTQLFLSFSVPFGEGRNRPTLSMTNSHLSNQGYNTLTTLSGQAGEQQQYNYSVSGSAYSQRDNSYALSGGYRSPYASLNASASSNMKGQEQTSLGLSGGIVAHRYGVTLANTLGDTFAIVHASHGQGAIMSDSSNNRLDWLGNGIYSYLTPYQYNDVGIDTKYVSPDVSFSATQTRVVPRKNAIMMVDFKTEYGPASLVTLLRQPGSEIPMGAEVYNGNNAIAVVGQGGQTYLRNIADGQLLTVKWQGRQCHFTFRQPPGAKKNALGFYALSQTCTGE